MVNCINIKPIRIGDLQENTANAITWYVSQIHRNCETAVANCSLLYLIDSENSRFVMSFQVEIDNDTLQSWGSDDSVIDELVLAYSPLFELQ